MTIIVRMLNAGGELDRRVVESPVDAPEAICEMALEAGELMPGDRFDVIDGDE